MGFVVGTLGCRGVALQSGEGLPILGGSSFSGAFKRGGLEALNSRELPTRPCHLLDQKRFVFAIEAKLIAIALQQAVEFGLIFVGEDGQFGGESMFEGVVANGGLARFSSRPGTELRVRLICVNAK